MRKAILAGSMALPRERVNVAQVKKACTLKYTPMGEDPLELLAFKEDREYLYVPRQLGLSICAREGIEFVDKTSPGVEVTFPCIPEPRDYQIDPLLDIEETFDSYFDFLFRARTGWGKTIGSLIVAARLGVSTLIIVDQENLKDQWIKALTKHFGFALEDIGTIQGKVCKYQGCAVTIAMVQTLSQRDFPQDVKDYFGFVLVDEVHIIGAPTFSRPLMDFSAMYRMGVSATPRRKDGLQKVLEYNLGRVRLYVDDEHPENTVFVARHGTVYSWYANTSPKIGRFITEVSEDGSRNLLIAESAAYLYDTGRDVLVLSDRIEHLQHLKDLCVYLGIPAEDMGVYAGYNPVYGYAKDPSPLRRPQGLTRNEETREYDYTPVSLQLISKRMKKASLEAIKDDARIIFATYGMFQKGVDVPRLRGGIDATPRSAAEQVHGRILREDSGLTSIWITIADYRSYRSLFGLAKRLPEYVGNNAQIVRWSLEEGEQACETDEVIREFQAEAKRLKTVRIEPNGDGTHTLATSGSRQPRERTPATATANTTPRPRADSRTASSPLGRNERSPRPTPQSSGRRSPLLRRRTR